VVTSEPLVKVVTEYVHKGSKLYLEGQAVVRKYTDKQGIERYRPEILLPPFRSSMTLLDKREGGSSAGDERSYGGAAPVDLDDEIPF
jgi:single-strand DNA-binding protein